ncbi:MAG: DegV family EDD domain-containing protein [Desulfobacterales bacterium]|nr:DegV family EDD domain-containing protein [Desulfobacterales bacterium]
MDQDLQQAFASGYERLVSWADLLDYINVFPVADSDTGCNLRISLAPLRQFKGDRSDIIRRLLVSATGNSGNIAARFFSGFILTESLENLFDAAKAGRDLAWQAIGDPKPGTMLTVFDELTNALEKDPIDKQGSVSLIDRLQNSVNSTTELLPELKQAGVVDAGALGMFIYLEGFFKRLAGRAYSFRPISKIFNGKLQVSSSFRAESTDSYCVDTLVHVADDSGTTAKQLSKYGKSVVAVPDKSYLKIHLHTDNPQAVRDKLESLGDIVKWSDDHMGKQVMNFSPHRPRRRIHVMTDAAGSVTRQTAQKLGMTLLDSYIIIGDRSMPETLCTPSDIYSLMRNGTKASTAQASIFERTQCYQSVMEQYPRVLYLCAGSVFTGNYNAVIAWKKENDPHDRLTVIDSGAASGRLGTVAIATVEFSKSVEDADRVLRFAEEAISRCEEYVFLDRLEYLVAGGRLSRTKGFFGDLFHKKPVISPTAEGAVKAGLVKDQEGQLAFALQRLKKRVENNSAPFIMLQYSDNYSWVNDKVKKEIERHYPRAKVMIQALSLTSGVHMGPGTWAVAFLPEPLGAM